MNRNIGLGKKYNGVPKLVKLKYEGAKPFHLVGTIPEYFKKVIKGSNRYRAVIKERHPVKDIANLNRFSRVSQNVQKCKFLHGIWHIAVFIPKTDSKKIS